MVCFLPKANGICAHSVGGWIGPQVFKAYPHPNCFQERADYARDKSYWVSAECLEELKKSIHCLGINKFDVVLSVGKLEVFKDIVFPHAQVPPELSKSDKMVPKWTFHSVKLAVMKD